MRARRAAAFLSAVTCVLAPMSGNAGAPPDAVAAVTRFVAALQRQDLRGAFDQLAPAQQRYFHTIANFASNYQTSQFRLLSYSVKHVDMRSADLVEVDVAQKVSYFDVAAQQMGTLAMTEQYFALRSGGRWGVKELFVPWKAYAPRARARVRGMEVIVDRVEFFGRHVQVDCTLRNEGTFAVTALPLLRSTLELQPGGAQHAIDDDRFPLNDRSFYQGVRIYPRHQAVGYIAFALPSQADESLDARLDVGPFVEDGGAAPFTVRVRAIHLPKL